MRTFARSWTLASALVAASLPAVAHAVTIGPFTNGPQMPAATAQEVVVAQDDKLYLFGGFAAVGGTAVNNVRVFDPATNTYADLAPLPTTVRGACGAPLGDGRILIIGGYDNGEVDVAQIYDPATDTWAPATGTPSGWECAAVLGSDGLVHLLGGESATTTHRVYDAANDNWLDRAPLPAAYATHGAGVTPDGHILVFGGGFSGAGVTSALFDTATNTWAAGPALPQAAVQSAFVTTSSAILALGGSTSSGNNSAPFFNTVQIYDPTTNAWTTSATTLATGVREANAAVVNGRIYLFGGSAGTPTALLQIAAIDTDEDGTTDPTDNCLLIANPAQTDTDGDGAGDECDPCPADPLDDADADMVCGDVDNCPDVANANQADADNDGVGDACDTPGTGGMGAGGAATGGSAGTGGQPQGGESSSGGSSSNGGSGAGGGGGGGDDGGCGCRVVSQGPNSAAMAATALLGLALLRRRRQRR